MKKLLLFITLFFATFSFGFAQNKSISDTTKPYKFSMANDYNVILSPLQIFAEGEFRIYLLKQISKRNFVGVFGGGYFNIKSIATWAYSFDGGESAERIQSTSGYKIGGEFRRRINRNEKSPFFIKTDLFYKNYNMVTGYIKYGTTYQFDIYRKVFCAQLLIEKQFKLELFSINLFCGIGSRLKYEKVIETEQLRNDIQTMITGWHEIKSYGIENSGHRDYQGLFTHVLNFTPQIGINLEF